MIPLSRINNVGIVSIVFDKTGSAKLLVQKTEINIRLKNSFFMVSPFIAINVKRLTGGRVSARPCLAAGST